MRLLIPMILLFSEVCVAQTNPHSADTNAAEVGRGVFRIFCSPCHGITGKGGRGPDLTFGEYTVGNQDADLYRVILEGVPGTEMPGFAERLGVENVWRLVSYLRSIARETKPDSTGNPQEGEKLFWGKGNCSQCHRIGDRGGLMGPDLTRVGRIRSIAYLRESVVSPNADLAPGYALITVTTRDGKTVVGVQRGIDNFSAQLVDAAGNYFSFLRSDVSSIRREFRSIMPGSYGQVYSESELRDLISFMSSLRGEEKRR